jgi:hypothetical protein
MSLSVAMCCGLRADDFRVDSKVFIGKESLPHSSNVTLFQGAHVYDFLDKPEQITFYDLDRGRIVLVDPQRKVKTEVSSRMLDAFSNTLRHSAGKDPLLQFALHPTFDIRDDKDGEERVFTSKLITYRVRTATPEMPDMPARYRQFSDLSARLNALVNRGSLPPFARLAVNESLDASGLLPAKVEFAASSGRLIGGHTVALRSQHDFRRRLLDSDLRRIDSAGALLTDSTQVSLGKFLNPDASSE